MWKDTGMESMHQIIVSQQLRDIAAMSEPYTWIKKKNNVHPLRVRMPHDAQIANTITFFCMVL